MFLSRPHAVGRTSQFCSNYVCVVQEKCAHKVGKKISDYMYVCIFSQFTLIASIFKKTLPDNSICLEGTLYSKSSAI